MSADDDEPEVPADDIRVTASVAEDAAAVRLPPGPGDRPISNLPPPEDDLTPPDPNGEVVDGDAEEHRVAAELGRLGSWLEPEEEQDASDARGLGDEGLPREASEVPLEASEVPLEVSELPLEVSGISEAPLEVSEVSEVEVADHEVGPLPPADDMVGAEVELDEPAGTEAPAAGAPEAGEPDRVAPPDPVAVVAHERAATAPRPAERRARRRRRVLFALLVVAVVSTAFAVTKTNEANDLRTELDDRRAIEVVAGRFASAYLSYDFANVEESGRAVTSLATEGFSRSYVAERAPGIEELFTDRQTTTEAVTTEVFVGAVGRRTARALVVVDVTATSATEGEQRLDDVSFVLDLTRTSVGWRVDAVDRAPQASLAEGATPVP